MKERHEHIEAYVSGQMTVEEETAFRLEMEKDEILARLVSDYQVIDESLADEDLINFVGMLDEVNEAHQSVTAAKTPVIVNWWSLNWKQLSVAASVSVVLICAYLFWPVGPSDLDVWFQENFTPYPSQAIRANNDVYPKELSEALQSYRLKDYKLAIAGLEPWLEDATHQNTVQFYFAQALLGEGLIEKAIPVLEKQLSGMPTIYDQSNEWSLALAYLKAGQIDEAREQARKIKEEPEHVYNTDAQQFLEDFPE